MSAIKKSQRQGSAQSAYSKIARIDGRHPLQQKVPEMCVMYQARHRKDAEVAYFNFELAKEMGLIAKSHQDKLTSELSKQLIDTFSLVIINEWDIENKKVYPKKEIKPFPYMATRYLQLQHASKVGKTSGDGRSIWNGTVRHNNTTWDISSCGTGATCLSPAAAEHGRNFKTGEKSVSYGCGLADFDDGLMAALMSEILHRKKIPTERTLCVLKYKDGTSINVRASQNLLRPAHMFRYLKMNDLENLRALTQFYLEREEANGNGEYAKNHKWDDFLKKVSHDFARSSAQYEREYIFCWMDWDGDNILCSGAAILDYGSVRQFGVFHKHYRYDDVERWSTTLLEQKTKARYTVQTFAQMIDFIKTGERRSIKDFENDASLKYFDDQFLHYKSLFLLKKMGLSSKVASALLKKHPKVVEEFEMTFDSLERLQTQKGIYKVDDGESSDAVFCMRDVLRELPRYFSAEKIPISPSTFIEIAKSSFAKPEDLKLSQERKRQIATFQKQYLELSELAAQLAQLPFRKLILEVTMRSSLINRSDFLTGNGVISVAHFLSKKHKNAKAGTSAFEIMRFLPGFIQYQSDGTMPESFKDSAPANENSRSMKKVLEIVQDYNEDI